MAPSKLKEAVSQLVRRSPIPSTVFAAPRHYSSSTLAQSQREAGIAYRAVFPATTIQRQPSRTWAVAHEKLEHPQRLDVPDSFVACLKQGRVFNRATGIATSGDCLLGDLSAHPGRFDADDHYLLGDLRPRWTRRVPGAVCVLASEHKTASCYYHWMLDALPRLHLCQQSGDFERADLVYVQDGTRRFQRETLDILGVPPDRIITSDEVRDFVADELIVGSYSAPVGWTRHETINFLRDAFLPRDAQSKPGRLLYVSRQDGNTRAVGNESGLEAALSDLGFETVTLSTMSVREQAALFHQADAIVGGHGSGLTNLVFCQPGTIVVELFAPSYVPTCFWGLAEQLGLKHWHIVGDSSPLSARQDAMEHDIIVDVPQLTAAVAAVLDESSRRAA